MRILLIAALALVSACGDGSDSSVMETAAEAVDAVQAMRVPACDDTQVVQAVGLQIRGKCTLVLLNVQEKNGKMVMCCER
jgi:hypothetical protein